MRKYLPFFKAGMMDEMAYKTALFSWAFVTALQLGCTVFLWVAVYANSESDVINGFTFKQMIVYMVMANILGFTILNTSTLWYISDEIRSGVIAISFIRPISYRIRFLMTAFGGCFFRMLIIAAPAYVISFAVFIKIGYIQIESIPRFICSVMLFFISQITALAIYDTINYICGVLCFYTTASWGMDQAMNVLVNFFSGILIPLSFFPGIFGRICEQLPFAGLTQNPVLIITQAVGIKQAVIFIVKNIVWFVIFHLVAELIFKQASKKVTVQGG